MAAEELGPLPQGKHGLSREQIRYSQRERLVAGFAEAVVEHGYNTVTITHITKAARVSRRAFYENFDSKEECFLATFDIVVDHLRDLIVEAIGDIEDWPHRVIAAVRTMLGFFAEEPDLARLCMVDSLTAGVVIAGRFQDTIHSFIPLLQPGRKERTDPRPLPESTEDSLIGGFASLISRMILAGKTEQLPSLLPDAVEFLLTPYLGAERASEIAAETASG